MKVAWQQVEHDGHARLGQDAICICVFDVYDLLDDAVLQVPGEL